MIENVVKIGYKVAASNSNTVLDILIQRGIEVEYNCKDGYCGACRCKLKSGDVKYTQNTIAFIHDGEILTCCTKPVTDIEIEI